jgi:hypothetical protein
MEFTGRSTYLLTDKILLCQTLFIKLALGLLKTQTLQHKMVVKATGLMIITMLTSNYETLALKYSLSDKSLANTPLSVSIGFIGRNLFTALQGK